MNRAILLLEPDYQNKYPPIGLMKIATYHRRRGDQVRFFKGDLKEFMLEQLYEECLNRLHSIDHTIKWHLHNAAIKGFLRTAQHAHIEAMALEDSPFRTLAIKCLRDYASIFRKKRWADAPKWDRVYVTTLFTFYWKITVETVQFAKNLVRSPEDIRVGGVLASLLSDELETATGIRPMKGLLDKPGMLDAGDDQIVDDLPLDYSILDEVDYEYPTRSAYFTFMTKGCTRKCAFCSVPILEPTYKPKIETLDKFGEIKRHFGDQQNLLLMDNNVLASPRFEEIIEEIKAMGFTKGATFIEPNQLEIAIKNIKEGYSVRAITRRAFKLLHQLQQRLKGEIAQTYYDILDEHELLRAETVTKENLLAAYPQLAPIYEKHRSKSPKARYVDFNQGTDARYVTEERMKLMSEIPIRPLRIAFDYLGLKKQYVNAVRLAAKYGIKELSNYILYNFKDTPVELYERLKINVELCEELNINIYSFPMKYIPLFGEEAKDRHFIGEKWNRKFIRAVQSILNVTKGIVASERTFFEKAFGRTAEDFLRLLYMPEAYLIYRKIFEEQGFTDQWSKEYEALTIVERCEANSIIEQNDFRRIELLTDNPSISRFLQHYSFTRDDVESAKRDGEYQSLKKKFDQLIRKDQFLELTLTYDYEFPVLALPQ